MKPILFAFAALLACSACRTTERRDDTVKEDAVHEESALQEYVNEPKRRAQNVKTNLEAAQNRERDQALAASDDEPPAASEDE